MSQDGINYLIQVTSMKSRNANAQAMQASEQKALQELQLRLRTFRTTLSLPAMKLLDQWLHWASLHRHTAD